MDINLRTFKYFSIAIFLLLACSIDNTTSAMKNLRSEPCDCEKTFEELIVKLESNYIGLALITEPTRLASYDSLKRDYRAKSKGFSAESCAQFLNIFLSSFKDGHLFTSEYPQVDSLTIINNQKFIQSETKELGAINELAIDTSDSIIGLWTDGESIFRIVKNQSYFDAYILKSNRTNATIGSLKLRLLKTSIGYEGTYYAYNFNTRYVKGNIYKENEALRLGAVKWNKTLSETTISENILAPRIRKIDDENSILTLPSFSIDYKDFQKFLKEHKKLIKETSHLIIDVRGNAGGNAIYFPLFEYFATRVLTSRQGYVLTSDDNRDYFERNIGGSYSKIYSPLLKRMKENGEIVDGPQYPERDFSPSKNKIQRVSILMDNGSASAAESFILHAKGASDKVMTFGSPSRGMIDFTSVNSILLKNSGNRNIYFGYPTGTLNKEVMERGFNKTGIIPDIPIPANENKIQFIIDYYSK